MKKWSFPGLFLYGGMCLCNHVWIYLGAGKNSLRDAGQQSRQVTQLRANTGPSHAFKLIDTLFGVARPNLSEGLVLVSSCSHVLCVEDVIHRFLTLISSVCQL